MAESFSSTPICNTFPPTVPCCLNTSVLFYSSLPQYKLLALLHSICYVLSWVPLLLSALSVSSSLYQYYLLWWSQLDRILCLLFLSAVNRAWTPARVFAFCINSTEEYIIWSVPLDKRTGELNKKAVGLWASSARNVFSPWGCFGILSAAAELVWQMSSLNRESRILPIHHKMKILYSAVLHFVCVFFTVVY